MAESNSDPTESPSDALPEDSQPARTNELDESMGTSRVRTYALIFEFGLAGVAIALGWLFGFSPLRTLRPAPALEWLALLGWGLLGVLPMLGMLAWIETSRFPTLVQFRSEVRELLRQIFAGATWSELALLSVAAGVGEELLFRGLLQDGVSRFFGSPASTTWLLFSLVLASCLFALCHWLNRTYAFLAMLAGAYLGAMFIAFDHLAPVVITHAVYDFLALVYVTRSAGARDDK